MAGKAARISIYYCNYTYQDLNNTVLSLSLSLCNQCGNSDDIVSVAITITLMLIIY